MDIIYDKFIMAENEIYKSITNITIPTNKSLRNEQLDKGLDWLCDGSDSVLDFGCGTGSMLFSCALRGVKKLTGIDLSKEAIKLCKNRAKLMELGKYEFMHGSVSKLEEINSNSIDGVILSNTVDNIKPSDAVELLKQVKRILKASGKVFVKLNPFITEKQIEEWNIKVIEGNLLDDGLMLWNQTTDEWRNLLSKYFMECEYIDIYFPEHEQYNRMFLMVNQM